MVIMDKKSSSKHEDVDEALKPLKEDEIKVVPVAVGPDANVDELKNITSAEGYLVTAEKTTDPTKLAEKIMAKVTTGRRLLSMLHVISTHLLWNYGFGELWNCEPWNVIGSVITSNSIS